MRMFIRLDEINVSVVLMNIRIGELDWVESNSVVNWVLLFSLVINIVVKVLNSMVVKLCDLGFVCLFVNRIFCGLSVFEFMYYVIVVVIGVVDLLLVIGDGEGIELIIGNVKKMV